MEKRTVSCLAVGSVMVGSLLFGGASEFHAAAAGDGKSAEPISGEGIVAGELAGHAVITNKEDGSVKIVYTAKNQTPRELDLMFRSGLDADYIIYDEKGKKVSQYSDGLAFTANIRHVPLKQGEELEYEFVFEGLPNGSYSIKLFLNVPEHRAEITKEFKVENAWTNIENFKDVSNDFWAKAEIDYLMGEGIIRGYQDETFKPNNHVTNSQAAIMLVRALKLNTYNPPNPGFSDVSPAHPAYKEIAAAVNAGLFPGGETFHPNESISRESMARALVNAFKLQGTKSFSFSDVPASYWAYPYIAKLAENDITTGYSDGTFKPKNNVTRAQFAAFTARALSSDYRPKLYGIPGNMNPVDILFRFALVNAEEAQKLFLPGSNFDVKEFAKGVKEFQLNALKEVARKDGKVEFSATFSATLAEDYKGSLNRGKNHLYFLIERLGFMEFRVVSVGTAPHILPDVSNPVSDGMIRALLIDANSHYWHVVSGGNTEGEIKSFHYKGKEYRYLGEEIGTMAKLLAFLKEAYTTEAAQSLVQELQIVEVNGKTAQPNADGGSLLEWGQAAIKLINETETEKTYQVAVPIGDSGESEDLQVGIQFVPEQGWRVNQLQ
ncbi:MAG TPA: S-layer homology domain-containing protein [Bacillus sp. (in: firmicutes)]|nr:S-layer homology domain-containing protein [Bacillus sp. (in: firmicutes)]